MTFILKTTEHAGSWSPLGSDNEHCLYADIVSVSFRREEGGAATAHCYLREPVKMAEVPGFCEVEKFISFTGAAYVMNEAGKTVSTFTARTSGEGQARPTGAAGLGDDHVKHMVDRFLGWKLPANFNPDAGISFKAEFNEHTAHPMRHDPSGTNLLDATQATAMVRHMLEGLPHA